MAAVLTSIVMLLLSTLVCCVKSDANVTTPVVRIIHPTRNASSGSLEPSVTVCLLTREGAGVLDITLECRPVPPYQNISWSIKRPTSTSWENIEANPDERFEVSLRQLRISRVTSQDNGLRVECFNTCTRFKDIYTVTYDGQSIGNETCPPLEIKDATDSDPNFNITCFSDSPRQLHVVAYIWIAIGVFGVCVCLVGVLCYTVTKRPRDEQGDMGSEPTAGTSSDDPQVQANRTSVLGTIYSTSRDIFSSNTLSTIQTCLSPKREASTPIGNASTADEGVDATPAVDKPEASKRRSKHRGVKKCVQKASEEATAGASSDTQTHRRDMLGIIYSTPRDVRKSTTLTRIKTLLSIGNTSSAEGLDAIPAADGQPDKPETSTMRSKHRGEKTHAKTVSGEGWLDDRPYVNV